MKKITLITGNPGKVADVNRYIGFEIDHLDLDLPEIQSLSSREIVEEKVLVAYAKLGMPVLVEDVSFVIHSLGTLPGPFIKWFERSLGYEGICRLLDGKDRACTASVQYAYFDGERTIFSDGEMKGSVSHTPRGENSFGWGKIFIPNGMNRTYAELTDDEKSEFAMRKKALFSLRKQLADVE
ncbi:MAG: non-canonical purine NTP pyrophosphatase [Candidatus Moraniibacteriota bacterium]